MCPRTNRTSQGSRAGLASFEMIETVHDLEMVARDLLREDVIGVDTEADSFYHYFDKTCLVQVATRSHRYLIDPLAMGGPKALEPLGPVFASPDVKVIFHAAEYDIFVLKRDCNFTFANLFDTMVSAQLLGYPGIGLAALIEHHFGVKLAKDEQRSDWSRRPLTERQLAYAASDVEYLIRLERTLARELKKEKRFSWAMEEFALLIERRWPERPFDKLGYLKIKGARKLDADSLSVLKQLYLLRDKRARAIDRPAFKVLGNRALLDISEQRPSTQNDLAAIKGVSDLILRRMGSELLTAVNKGKAKPHGPIPKSTASGTTTRRRMDRQTEQRLTVLKRWRAPRSKEVALEPGVLCSNASLEAIAWQNPQAVAELSSLPELKNWFVDSFGEEIVNALAEAPPAEAPPSTDGRRKKRRSKPTHEDTPPRPKKQKPPG